MNIKYRAALQLGWRPHTVKGPEIGRHPNASPAGEWRLNSGGKAKRGWLLAESVSTNFSAEIPQMGDTQTEQKRRESTAMRLSSAPKSAGFVAIFNRAIYSIRESAYATFFKGTRYVMLQNPAV